MFLYMELAAPSCGRTSNHPTSPINYLPRGMDEPTFVSRHQEADHRNFVGAQAKNLPEVANPQLGDSKFFKWVTCQEGELNCNSESLPKYKPSDESKEPLNKYMLVTPNTTHSFEKRNGVRGILHIPRKFFSRERRNTKVRWRDQETLSMCMGTTMCTTRSPLKDVVDDTIILKKMSSIPLRRHPTPRLSVSVPFSNQQPPVQLQRQSSPNNHFSSKPRSPPPSQGNLDDDDDPIVAFRECETEIKR